MCEKVASTVWHLCFCHTKIYYTYDAKGAIMGMIYGGETYMFSKNMQGDVIGIYNPSRQLVAKYKNPIGNDRTRVFCNNS